MTVTITQNLTDIAGVDDNSPVWFSQALYPRVAEDGSTMITTRRVSVTPVSGVLTVELEPGPARVQIGQRHYDITVPDIDATLWPLIETGLPAPESQVGAVVRNGGGIARLQKITESAYAALVTPDPETEYSVVPD